SRPRPRAAAGAGGGGDGRVAVGVHPPGGRRPGRRRPHRPRRRRLVGRDQRGARWRGTGPPQRRRLRRRGGRAPGPVTLTDAGPLIALIDADEPDHATCVMALRGLRLPLVTTWPAFTEAMYLLSRAGGAAGRHALRRLLF